MTVEEQLELQNSLIKKGYMDDPALPVRGLVVPPNEVEKCYLGGSTWVPDYRYYDLWDDYLKQLAIIDKAKQLLQATNATKGWPAY